MSKSVNNVTLLGRLTRDVELKDTKTGKKVGSFTIAVDKQGKDDSASFIDVTVWEKTAEYVAQYAGKGLRVAVVGRLDQQTWEKDGQKQSKIVVIANEVTVVDRKEGAAQPLDTVAPVDTDAPIDLADIPF